MFSKKKENLILDILSRIVNGSVQRQFTDEGLNYHYILQSTFPNQIWDPKKKHVHPLRFDAMCILNTMIDSKIYIAVEYNGPYHYYFRNVKRTKHILLSNDWLKRIWCRANDVHLICISPAAVLTDRYIRFRINAVTTNRWHTMRGPIQQSSDSVILFEALNKVRLNTLTWCVEVIRDDDNCITCMISYSLDANKYCRHPDMNLEVRRKSSMETRFTITCWKIESLVAKTIHVEGMLKHTQIHLPFYLLSTKNLVEYLTCRIIDEIDDICLFAKWNRDVLFYTDTISQCIAKKIRIY